MVFLTALGDGGCLGDDISCLELGLTRRRLRGYGLISVFDILRNHIANLVSTLAKHNAIGGHLLSIQIIGGTILIVGLRIRDIVSRLVNLIGQGATRLRRVPVVPLAGVVHLVGQDITLVVVNIVGQAEDVVSVHRVVLGVLDGFAGGIGVGVGSALEGGELI